MPNCLTCGFEIIEPIYGKKQIRCNICVNAMINILNPGDKND